jgi:glycosyltransferase involved in cell wall biosynthesis
MPAKKVIAVLYEYFYPGFRAGGPIQSLVNMVQTLQHEYDFKIITTAYDLNSTAAYSNVQLDAWNAVSLSEGLAPVKIWYASTPSIGFGQMQEILQQAAADIVFINGLYTKSFAWPLLLKKMGKLGKSRIIVSPRGMLQKGALDVKPLKKKLFLQAFKTAGLFRNVSWHATTDDEKDDILQKIGQKAKIIVAANIPKKPVTEISIPEKKEKELKLVYLSIITQKKNLLQLIAALHKVQHRISLDIYGPIKEASYWQLCQEKMIGLPANISIIYKADLQPYLVQSTIQQYHALALLTHGENFGHALYESLSAGRPIITSHFTPWLNLEAKQAGWNCPLEDDGRIAVLLQQIAELDQVAFNKFCNGAWKEAKSYYSSSDFIHNYSKLFA